MKLAGNPLIKKQMAGSGKGGGSAQAKAPAGWEGGGASAPSQEKPSAQPPEVGAGPDARKDAGSSPKEEAPAPVKGDPGGGDGEADFETSSMGFAVQVGAFLMEKNARSLAADLEGRGYTPYVFKAQDAKDRTWYAVRMGDYGDKKEASQAASEFEKKEKMRTVVRPAGAF